MRHTIFYHVSPVSSDTSAYPAFRSLIDGSTNSEQITTFLSSHPLRRVSYGLSFSNLTLNTTCQLLFFDLDNMDQCIVATGSLSSARPLPSNFPTDFLPPGSFLPHPSPRVPFFLYIWSTNVKLFPSAVKSGFVSGLD